MTLFPGDTPVLTIDGTWKPVASLAAGDRVVGRNGGYAEVEALEGPQEAQEGLLRLSTRLGRTLALESHQDVLSAGNWVKASDLMPGDPLEIVARPDPENSPKFRSHLDPAMFALAGFFAARGNSTYHTDGTTDCRLMFASKEEADKACALITAAGLRYSTHYQNTIQRYLVRLRKPGNRTEYDLLFNAGRSTDREVPPWIFRAADSKVKAYIVALMGLRAKPYNQTLYMSFKSQKLARGVQRALTRLGVPTRVHERGSRWLTNIDAPHLPAALAVGLPIPKVLKPKTRGVDETAGDIVQALEVESVSTGYTVRLKDGTSLVLDGIVLRV